jgi:broad specificity phosphatase PhoE
MRYAVASLLAFLLSATSASAQGAVFIVRHAERADTVAGGATMMATDPDLSAVGLARAESLAAMLKDARIAAIFTTEYKRTRQTAAPLARVAGVEPVTVPSKDVESLVGHLKRATTNVLVVGHSNSVPAIVKALGIQDEVTIAEDEFDNLLVVVRAAKPTLLRLRYR